MSSLKTLVFNRFRLLSLLFIAMGFSLVFLMVRVKLSQSFFFLFLVWNLILALIPFLITVYLQSRSRTSKLVFGFWFLAWLLFLPNAPYIFTDLLHIRLSDGFLIWMDIVLVLSFALNGLILFFLSVRDMKMLLSQYIKPKYTGKLIVMIIFLSGFGMYLGRFLRYNSWEIVNQPMAIFVDIRATLLYPGDFPEAWLFTFGFGSLLLIGYRTFEEFLNHKESDQHDLMR